MVFAIALWMLQVSIHNSFKLYRLTNGRAKCTFLDFIRPVVQTYRTSFGKSAAPPVGQALYRFGRKKVDHRVPAAVRFDNKVHYLETQGKKTRCG